MPTPSEYQNVGDLRRGAADLAEAVLDLHWPEGTLPIDPVKVARSLSLEVFDTQLGDDVFGMLVGVDGQAGVIYVDEDQPPTRKRFTVAHEIGHFLDRNSRLDEETAYIDKRSDDDPWSRDEIWANEVAGNLLMPKKALLRAIEELGDEFMIADRFAVSVPALRYRKKVLGI